MNISLNGRPYSLEEETNVTDLLRVIGLADKPVVVELNEEAVIPRNFSETPICGGDKVEIITLAAGG